MKALLFPLLSLCCLATHAVAGDYLIENANVIPMTEEVVLEGHSVRVQGGRIAAICEPGRACGDGGTETIDGRGKFLIPGLTDMHAHTNPGENASMEVAQREMVRRIQSQQLRQYVMFGVTTIRDPAGGPANLRAREKIRQGAMVGPRLFSSQGIMDDPPLHPAGVMRLLGRKRQATCARPLLPVTTLSRFTRRFKRQPLMQSFAPPTKPGCLLSAMCRCRSTSSTHCEAACARWNTCPATMLPAPAPRPDCSPS